MIVSRIQRDRISGHGRYYWSVNWHDSADPTLFHGIGGWSHTKLGARFAVWNERRRGGVEVES